MHNTITLKEPPNYEKQIGVTYIGIHVFDTEV
jgi:hypothetical protein